MTMEKRILYSVCLISFAGSFLSTAVNLAIPVMAGEFSVPPDCLSWIVTAFLIPTAACLLPMGKVSDVYGRRRIYAAALIAFAVTTLATVFVPSFACLLAVRVLQGIALAAVYVSYMPLLLATAGAVNQGRILGICVGLTYFGLSMGPVLGGVMTEYTGWRSIFITSALMTAAAYMYIRPIKKEWYAGGAPFVNIVSSALSAAAIILFLWGLSAYRDTALPLWAGIVLLILFILHESRSYHPLLPLFVFRNLTFSMANLAAFIQYSATYALSFLLSLQLQIVAGLSPAASGLILLIQPLVMAVLSPKAGALSDRYGTRRITSSGLILTTLGLACFSWKPESSPSTIVFFLVLVGAGSALFGAPNNSAIMSAVKPAYHGIASSMLALARNLGQATSMAAVTLILSSQTALIPSYADAISAALRISYRLLAALCFIAVFASLARGKGHTAESKQRPNK